MKPVPEFPLHLIGYILPLVTILVSIPMALGKVKPNRFYGFRTPKTLSSPAMWYPANRACGQYMIIASAVSLVFNLSYWLPHRDLPIPALVLPMAAATVICRFPASASACGVSPQRTRIECYRRTPCAWRPAAFSVCPV